MLVFQVNSFSMMKGKLGVKQIYSEASIYQDQAGFNNLKKSNKKKADEIRSLARWFIHLFISVKLLKPLGYLRVPYHFIIHLTNSPYNLYIQN